MSADSQILATKDIVAELCQIEDPTTQARALEDFMAARIPMFDRLAASLCRSNSVPPAKFAQDISAIVAQTAWVMLTEALANPSTLADIITWEAILYHRARPLVRSFTDKAEAPASGMVGARRRQREVAKTRTLLRTELSREPTHAEIIETTNTRIAATVADPARHSMVITAADLEAASVEPLNEGTAGEVPFDDDYLLHPVEGAKIVHEAVQRCHEHDEVLGQVASMWFDDAYSGGGPPVGADTITYIMSQLGLTRAQVRRHVERVREVAIEMLGSLGIESPG